MTLLQAAPVALDSIKGLAQEMGLSKNMPVDDFIDTIIKKLGHFAINLAIAVLVFYVGKMLINWIHRVMKKVFVRRKVDASLATFVLSMVKIVLYFMLIVIIIGILGIETSSFIALFASAGVAIGMTTIAAVELPQYGPQIRAVILCATLIYELLGPVLTKIVLTRAGEIRPEPRAAEARH